jgi:two-component system cell cycle response regulator DivK
MEKVMIFDSDLSHIKSLNEGLLDRYHVLAVNSGEKALELIQLYRPSALILDPGTVGLDAKKLIQQLRSRPYLGQIPILALTHFLSVKNIEISLDLGADSVFYKPCSPDRVRRKLDSYFIWRKPKPEPEVSLA